jgi:hypothetical protein
MEDFCNRHASQLKDALSTRQMLPQSSQEFLAKLNLPMIHPICSSRYGLVVDTTASHHLFDDVSSLPEAAAVSTALAPDMGPTPYPIDLNFIEKIVTDFWFYIYPSFALLRIWFIFLSGYIATGFIMMWLLSSWTRWMKHIVASTILSIRKKNTNYKKLAEKLSFSSSSSSSVSSSSPRSSSSSSLMERSPFVAMFGLMSSWVVLTDDGYNMEFGRGYGAFLFLTTLLILRPRQRRHYLVILFLVAMSHWFISPWYCEDEDNLPTNVKSGLYYNSRSPTVEYIISLWDTALTDYSKFATPWQWTGDGRTGMPYTLNTVDRVPTSHRVWLPTDDEEFVALDISFPDEGHNWDKPLYLVLHGLNGGSSEGYVIDFTRSRNLAGSTVCVMIARGLDDTPIQGWTVRFFS